MNSTKESTPETQGGWNTFSINVQRSTRGEYIIHLDRINERRKCEEHVLGAQLFQWIDMQVTLLRSTEDIINSLISPEDHDLVGKCTFQVQQLPSSEWGNSNLLNDSTSAFDRHFYGSIQKIKFLLGWFK